MTNLTLTSRSEDAGARWLRYAMGLWWVFFVAFSIKTLIEPVRASVYPAFSGGARDWWAGRPLYGNLGFYYSPTFAVSVTPFAALPDRFGGIAWNLASMLLLIWSLRVFVRDVAGQKWSTSALAAFMALTLLGSLRGMWSAQSNAIVLAMVLLGAAAIAKERWWAAAFWLAAPVYIKVWPVVAAALLIALWPKKLSWRFGMAMVVFGCVPFLTKSPATVVEYYRSWFQCLVDRQGDGVRWGGYRDAWTIWEQIRSPVTPLGYKLLQAGAGLAALGWCLWQKWRGVDTRRLLVYTTSIWAAWQLLFGPGTERLTYGLIAPAMAWGVVTCYLERRHRPLIYFALPLTYLIGAGQLERLLLPLTTAGYALQPLGIVAFVVWLVAYTWSKPQIEQLESAISPPCVRRAPFQQAA